ncbi:nucleotidyltransferase domain-containing protein [Caenimonas sp. SL110]|uniref:MarR family transcriptional regulator n=1 Tax=Caenimonas sp. SL110 TaxID=1450524 RepID=UPI0006547B24|nr:nucleotidyltransferase domain-containing protein [Caenimonas sp. SL110]
MHQTLSSVLFPEYRRRILGLLLLRPEDALHGREIARRAGLPAGTVTRELTRLAAVGLLKREKRGNQQVYSADTASPIYSELASILRKTSGIADVIAQLLMPLAPLLRVAFIFGSIARGEETSGSDVDLMLIGDLTLREAVEVLYPAQQTIGREINPQVLSAKEFQAKARKDQYLADLMARPKIFVIGTEHDLEELVGHQP